MPSGGLATLDLVLRLPRGSICHPRRSIAFRVLLGWLDALHGTDKVWREKQKAIKEKTGKSDDNDTNWLFVGIATSGAGIAAWPFIAPYYMQAISATH